MNSWNNISNSERSSYSSYDMQRHEMLTSFKWFILTNRSGRDFLLATTLSTAPRQLRLPSGKRFRFCLKVVNFLSLNHESSFNSFMILLCFGWPHDRFVFATESYGGFYGPRFVTFFDEQNAKIEAGQITGEKITVSALVINKWVTFVSFVGLYWRSAVVGMILSSNIKPL